MAGLLQTVQQALDRPEAWPTILSALAGAIILGIVYSVLTGSRPYAGIPMVTLTGKPDRWEYMLKPMEIMSKAEKETSGPFQVLAASTYKIIIPSRHADELKSHPDLDFQEVSRVIAHPWPVKRRMLFARALRLQCLV